MKYDFLYMYRMECNYMVSYNIMIYGMDILFLFKVITEVYLVTRIAFLLQPSNDGSFQLLCINDQQRSIVLEKLGFGTVRLKCYKGGLFQSNHWKNETRDLYGYIWICITLYVLGGYSSVTSKFALQWWIRK